jgi:NADH-quinone oxidoreductase subunit J
MTVMTSIVFGLTAIVLLIAAFSVVTARDLIRCVLWLAVALVSTAVLFVVAEAEFIAAVQILLYTGGIITLMLFGVMLTARITSAKVEVESFERLRGAVVALTLFGLMAWAILTSELPAGPATLGEDVTREVGRLFLTDWLLPMELLSVLLLAVMIGAIALARRKDP